MKYLVLMFFSVFVFTNCSSDDSNTQTNKNQKDILGVWVLDKGAEYVDPIDYGEKVTMEFKKDGYVFAKYFEKLDRPEEYVLNYFFYRIENDSLYFTYENGKTIAAKIDKLTSEELIYTELYMDLKTQEEVVFTSVFNRE